MTATQWLNGANTPVPKISLDPAKREHGDAPIIVGFFFVIFILFYLCFPTPLSKLLSSIVGLAY